MRRIAFVLAVLMVAIYAMISAGHADTSTRIAGNHPKAAEHRAALGNLEANAPMTMEIHLKLRNRAELDQFLIDVQNPASSKFRKFLKRGEFEQKYGALQSDLDAMATWLRGEGFAVTATQGSVQFTGTAAQAEKTFAVHEVKLSAKEFSNLEDPMVPARFASLVGDIQGLNNLIGSAPASRIYIDRKKAQLASSPAHKMTRAEALAAVGVSGLASGPTANIGGVSYGDEDMRNTYDVPADFTLGSGDCLGIVGDSDYLDAALTTFTDQFSDLPAIDVTRVLAPTNPGRNSDEAEAELDLEWSHVMAPGAPIKFYLGSGASNLQNAITKAINDDNCPVVSISFEFCGGHDTFYTATLDGLFVQAASQGQSVFVSSGDHGAAGSVAMSGSCVSGTSRNVSEMASDPHVTAVGGTQILNPNYDQNSIAQSYATETVWNDAENNGGGGNGATGGGASTLFSKPAYQSGPGVPNDAHRDIPDVALLSGYPRVFWGDGRTGTAILNCCEGGTSLAAPMWAGIAKDLEKDLGPLGTINSTVYSLANQQYGGSHTPEGFHDVTSGDNGFNGVTGFNGATGYDQATGWGSVDFATFKNAFENNQPSATATATMTATPVATTTVMGSPTSVNLGSVDASSSSKPRRVSFINRGANTASLGTVTASAGYSISSDTCSNQTIVARRSCTVMVTFSPSVPGPVPGTLTVSYNGASPATINLSGTGTAVMVKGPARVAFPIQAAGTTGSAPRNASFTNFSRTASVTFGSTPTLIGPFVIASDTCSNHTIGPHGRCSIGLEFSPPAMTPSRTTLSGTLSLGYTYGSNSGMSPNAGLSGRVK